MTSEHNSTPRFFASFAPSPRSSHETVAGLPSVCSTNIQTPRYSFIPVSIVAALNSVVAAIHQGSSFLRCEIHLKGLCWTYLDAPSAANALCGIYDRLTLFIHFNSIFGQSLWQRAPHAMHFPGISRATPRGFFIFFSSSIPFCLD